MEWHHLKCRAETLYDVCQFIVWVNKRNYNYEDSDVRLVYSRIEPLGSSECTWEFETNLRGLAIRRLMREAELEDEDGDFHIMRQTLEYIEIYDGERCNTASRKTKRRRKTRMKTKTKTKRRATVEPVLQNQSRYSK